MFRGYQLELDWDSFRNLRCPGNMRECYNEYNRLKIMPFVNYIKPHMVDYEQTIKSVLQSFILEDGVLDGDRIQEVWFPQIEADVFISHSHKDERLAMAYAGWLKKVFGLNVFIDSCVWKNYADLLEMIDKKYCRTPDRKHYVYELRNSSTAHVHMMLSVALNQMIDQCECLFFLNTPNSVACSTDVQRYTGSPWIYNEISTSRTIRRHISDSKPGVQRTTDSLQYFSVIQENIMRHPLDMEHLYEIGGVDLSVWQQKWSREILRYNSDSHPLDILYKITEP